MRFVMGENCLSPLQVCFNGSFIQPLTDDDDYLLPLRDGRKGAAGGGGVQLQPAACRGGRKALDPQHLPALGRCEQPLCGGLQLLWGEVQFQKAKGGKGRVLVKMQLFAAGLPVAAGGKGGNPFNSS